MSTKTSTAYHPQPPPRAGKKPLSLLAQYDDLVRNANALSAGDEEGKFSGNWFMIVAQVRVSSSAYEIDILSIHPFRNGEPPAPARKRQEAVVDADGRPRKVRVQSQEAQLGEIRSGNATQTC